MKTLSAKNILKRIMAIMLVSIMILGTAACADSGDNGSAGTDTTASGDTGNTAEETTQDRFAGIDYNGRPFRISTSINTNDATNANHLIEGSGELTGEVVNDAVYLRNQAVEDLLGITFEYTQTDLNYGSVTANIRTLIMSGEDAFDVIINDLYQLCELTFEGMFLNVNDSNIFDFDQKYWYKGYMDNLKLTGDRSYILAGDYFMDVLASAHALFYNKDLFNDIYGNGEIIYDHVLDGTWTLETMTQYINDVHNDLNGDSKINENDRIGFACYQTWGSMIPFVIGSDIQFVSRESDGSVSGFDFNNERSVTLLERLNKLFYDEGTLTSVGAGGAQSVIDFFAKGELAFAGYQRLGSLEKMRDIPFDLGVIPYPKFDETQQNYVTSTHDTTEVGIIPMTCNDLEFASTVLEVLNRETEKTVLPEYYENALKLKYTRDQTSAKMIDIIHDSFGSTFPLGYGSSFGNFFLGSAFSDPLGKKSTDFSSNYTKLARSAQKTWEKKMSQFIETAYQ